MATNKHDETYHGLLKDVLENGELVTTRAVLPSTGRPVGAYTVFGRQVRYNLRNGFPLLTTKKVSFKLIASELLWFLSGSSMVQDLQKENNHIWDEWATKEQCAKFGREEGDLGAIYGPLWRRWEGISRQNPPAWEFLFDANGKRVSAMPPRAPYMNPDNPQLEREWNGLWSMGLSVAKIDQIANVIESIKKNPTGRRHIVSGWNPATCDKVALPPCHSLFQFNVSHGGTRLNCQLYQRSGDIFLGIPYNIASYALLTHMIAQVCGLEVGEFIHSVGDLHLYENHVEQAKEQLTRESFTPSFLALDPKIKNINDFKMEHIQLTHYKSQPAIKGEVAV
jgi:thymidylate synthase